MTNMTPLETIIDAKSEKVCVIDIDLFPVLNRLLNEKGYLLELNRPPNSEDDEVFVRIRKMERS